MAREESQGAISSHVACHAGGVPIVEMDQSPSEGAGDQKCIPEVSEDFNVGIEI